MGNSPVVFRKDDRGGLVLLWLDRGRCGSRIGTTSRLLGLDLLGQILDGLLRIGEGDLSDQRLPCCLVTLSAKGAAMPTVYRGASYLLGS